MESAGKPLEDNASYEKARQHGWMEASTIDYSAISAAAPEWASNAAVYEWDDDEGEIGPADTVLEEKLFKAGNQQRAGTSLDALNLTVTQEGPVKVNPVLNVSLMYPSYRPC